MAGPACSEDDDGDSEGPDAEEVVDHGFFGANDDEPVGVFVGGADVGLAIPAGDVVDEVFFVAVAVDGPEEGAEIEVVVGGFDIDAEEDGDLARRLVGHVAGDKGSATFVAGDDSGLAEVAEGAVGGHAADAEGFG